MKALLTSSKRSDAAGFSVIELLIVVATISIVAGMGIIQIVRSRQLMIRANAARELVSYLEKARLDSVRRRPATTAEMAQVSIINANFYSVTMDADGNGTLDAPRVMSLPTNTDIQFTGTFPRTIYFNWRGRTVDSTNTITTPARITLSSASYGSTFINISDAGQPAIGAAISSDPVSNSNPPAVTLRDNTQIP